MNQETMTSECRPRAKELLASGLCVLPAHLKAKCPALGKWTHYQKRLPTATEAVSMFRSSEAICIVTGAVSGNLELLDFDVAAEKFEPWAKIVHERLPGVLEKCFIERSQSGGKHVVYRCQEPVEGSMKLAMRVIECESDAEQVVAGKNYKPRKAKSGFGYEIELALIETKGEGGLFLCAPSPGYVAEQGDLTDLPVLSQEEHDTFIEAAIELNEKALVETAPPAWTHPSNGAANNKSKNTLASRQDVALRPGDDFTLRGDIREVLKKHGWKLWKPGDNEYWTRPGKPGGTSATLKDGVFYVFTTSVSPFEPNKGYSIFTVYAMLEHNGDFKAAARQLGQDGFGQRSDHRLSISEVQVAASPMDEVEHEADEAAKSTPKDPGPVPAELLRVPGFMNEVIDYTLECAPYPEPVLAFSGALSLQSVLAGRCVRDAADNRPSIYIVALANTGTGKDFPRKVNQRILIDAGLSAAIGDGFASGEGIEDRMASQPSVLFQTDEIDTLIRAIAGHRGQRDPRFEGIMQVLLKMYSAASSTYTMRVKANQSGPHVIDQPCLCLFGTAVPSTFFQALSPKMLNNGFFSRMQVLEAGPRGLGQDADWKPVPKGIMRSATTWASLQGSGITINRPHEPKVVLATDEARQLLRDIRVEVDHLYAVAEHTGDEVGMALWSRASEKMRRLALNYACSESPKSPKISRAGVRWARELVVHQTLRMLFRSGQHVSGDDFEARCKSVLVVLSDWKEKHGDDWMPYWKLSRKLTWETREHDAVRQVLVDQRRIEYQEQITGGPPRKLYRVRTR